MPQQEIQPNLAVDRLRPVDVSYRERCEERFLDLAAFLQETYAVPIAATRFLAAVLIPTAMPPVWAIIETNAHPFWRHFGAVLERLGYPPLLDAAMAQQEGGPVRVFERQMMKRRERSAWIWMEEDGERPGNDVIGEYRPAKRYPFQVGKMPPQGSWLEREAIRVRIPLELRQVPAESERAELEHRLRLVIDPTHRRLKPYTVELPGKVIELIEIAARRNRRIRMEEALYLNLGLLAPSHAAMMGRERMEAEDWEPVRLALQGMIRPWDRRILRWYWKRVGPESSPYMRKGRLPAMDELRTVVKRKTYREWPEIAERNGIFVERWLWAGWLEYRKLLRFQPSAFVLDLSEAGWQMARLIGDPAWDLIVEPDGEREWRP